MRRLTVEVPGRPYPVLIGEGADSLLPDFLTGRCLIVADTQVERLPQVEGTVVRIAGGEEAKTFAVVERLLGEFGSARLGRDGTVVAVGGGTIGDVVGFAASIWLRGIALVHVPTTLLAMVDSAIGGKTGINTEAAKNAVGTFWQPRAVLVDTGHLDTLPAEHREGGMAEVVKYAMTMDPLIAELGLGEELIERCVRCKATVVAADERESGGREVLNYGHTVAHALEVVSGYRLHHGRAVAAGMRAAARISARLGLCEAGLVGHQDSLLASHGLPGRLPHLDLENVLAALGTDKKIRGDRLRWVLLRSMGAAEPGHQVPAAVVRDVVAEILSA